MDGCRADLFDDLSTEYGFLDDRSTIFSANSMTERWMDENFTEENREFYSDVTYVCGNPYSEEVLDETLFESLIEVWKDYWDSESGTIPPRPITDTAISIWQDQNPEKLIIHYMQPHYPFLNYPALKSSVSRQSGSDVETINIWHQLRRGNVSRDIVYSAYLDNLDVVLSDIDLLLSTIDADKVVVTSDHGNALGEYGVYGHPPDMTLNCLRTVPWIETTASGTNSYDPKMASTDVDESVEDRLSDLGYIQ